MQVLKECNRESFWYRCVPLSLILVGSTQMMVNKGILKPNPRFGAIYKNFGAALIGYVAGKISYQGRCREKILQLENSQLADAIRHKRRGGALFSDTIDTPEYTGPFGYGQKSDLNVDVEYDASRGTDRHDETHRPSLDSDTLLPSTSRDNVTDSRISYDELRRLNRADHEKKKYESSSSRPSPPSQRDSVIQPQDSPKPHVKRNKYGDEIEV